MTPTAADGAAHGFGSSAGVAGAIRTGGGGRRGPLPYSDVIRDRWRRPRFRGELADPSAVAEDVNPLCGDRVRMSLAIERDRITAARFTGDSCAICTASADVLAELAIGRSAADASKLEDRDVLEILDTDVRPTRRRCVSLPIDVLKKALGAREESR